ncbi:heterokaryon incompatibility protein [Colletotrichum truncatum]|uniref:Heterokaryon incompatibility protein n=1 Tax=Colletotrichum truncatum TaxID=5467 RepID=A0ACC3YX75_COLTU|nr:heterokaryon incompatibility protein [Colletotrichum truncatum]KAF6791215.1 heterokaryon incompatibility protein [Colletotrichum truncatum]
MTNKDCRDAMDLEQYQYDKLPPGRWFRQLHILPGQPEDPLLCSLVTVSLDEAPPYKALSYVWGDPTKTASVICSEFQREITISLLEGLRRIRRSDRVEVAWADAICINQASNSEKEHQVNLMADIYDRAVEVVVWLGSDPERLADNAFTSLVNANSAIRTGTQNSWSTVPDASIALISQKDPSEKHSYPVNVLRSTLPQLLGKVKSEAIKSLFQLTWFTRVWVLQEVGLATSAIAYWGDCSIDFSEIATFIHFATGDEYLIRELGQEINEIISGSPYYAFWNVWSTYNKPGGWMDTTPVLKAFTKALEAECNIDFVLVLEASRRFNATNPLDHIFAFLGHPKAVLAETGRPLIQANYSLSLDELHLLVAGSLAKQSLNFLVQVQNGPHNLDLSTGIPSWIPHWNVNNEDAPSAFWEAWDTSLRIARQIPSTARVLGNELLVNAIIFDTVSLQTKAMAKTDFERFSWGPGILIEECWNLTEQAAKTSPPQYSDHQVPLAFASTLTCHYKTKNDAEDTMKLLEDLTQYCAAVNPSFFNAKLKRYDVSYRLLPLQQRYLGTKFTNYGTNRRFFVTKDGYWGLGPPLMQPGDVCAVLMGGDVPFILRPTGEEGKFKLVGQAYIYGVMYGEIVDNTSHSMSQVMLS